MAAKPCGTNLQERFHGLSGLWNRQGPVLGFAAPAVFGLNLYLSANFLKNSFNDTFVSLQEFFNKFARNLKIYLRKSRSGRPLAKLLGFCFKQKILCKIGAKFRRRSGMSVF
jgi:hypothetical protein